MHASVGSFRMSSTLSKPDTTALSAHRRATDQNAILCAAQPEALRRSAATRSKWAFAP